MPTDVMTVLCAVCAIAMSFGGIIYHAGRVRGRFEEHERRICAIENYHREDMQLLFKKFDVLLNLVNDLDRKVNAQNHRKPGDCSS